MLTLTELMLQRASLGAASCKVIPKKQYKKLLFPCCIYACSYVFYLKIFPRRPLAAPGTTAFRKVGQFFIQLLPEARPVWMARAAATDWPSRWRRTVLQARQQAAPPHGQA